MTKKSRWDLNAPKDKAEDFIVESLEGFLYDWLRCISNDKEDIDVIRDPIKLEKALSKLRSKAGFSEHSERNKRMKWAVNHTEMIEVTHLYLSLFTKLRFLTLLEGEGFPHSVYISVKKVRSSKSAIMRTNPSKRYILGTFVTSTPKEADWTIHQDTSVVPFFPFDLNGGIDQQTFWNVIRRNGLTAHYRSLVTFTVLIKTASLGVLATD